MKIISIAILALVIVGALRLPAAAADTSYLTLQGPNPVKARCPYTLTFNGSITGPGNSSVTFLWARFVNGHAQDSPPVTLTIPANGTLTLPPQQLNVDAATQGFQSYGINITAPANSDSATHGKVYLTASCASLIPSIINPGSIPPQPPHGLTNATDPPTCTAHANLIWGLACQHDLPSGALALIWTFTPGACSDCVDSYKVYRVDGGQHSFVANQAGTNGAPATLALLEKPSDGFSGKCYVVTTVYNGLESKDSAQFCPGQIAGGPTIETFTLMPSLVRSVYHHYSYTGVGPGCGLSNLNPDPGPSLFVGFLHNYVSAAGFTCGEDTFVDQTAIAFQLGNAGIVLRNPKTSVQSARLVFRKIDNGTVNCLAAVHLPVGDWSNAQDLIPNNDFISGIPWGGSTNINTGTVLISGANYSIDVSTAIGNWASGVWANHGFLLLGGNEDISGFHDDNTCRSQFGSFVLKIQVAVSS